MLLCPARLCDAWLPVLLVQGAACCWLCRQCWGGQRAPPRVMAADFGQRVQSPSHAAKRSRIRAAKGTRCDRGCQACTCTKPRHGRATKAAHAASACSHTRAAARAAHLGRARGEDARGLCPAEAPQLCHVLIRVRLRLCAGLGPFWLSEHVARRAREGDGDAPTAACTPTVSRAGCMVNMCMQGAHVFLGHLKTSPDVRSKATETRHCSARATGLHSPMISGDHAQRQVLSAAGRTAGAWSRPPPAGGSAGASASHCPPRRPPWAPLRFRATSQMRSDKHMP